MSAVQLFQNGEFELRVTEDGDTFTVAAPGLARALAFAEARDMIRSLPSDEKGSELSPTPGGRQKTWFVREPGFYRIIGQRQPARIKDPAIRAQVVRFQDWIYKEVLPTLRRTGRYELIDEPTTYTWDEVATLFRQRFGIPTSVANLTRTLRDAGVLRQTGVPKVAHRQFFWFTGTSWQIHPYAVPFLARKFEDTRRQLQELRFIQARLELEGVGREVDAA